MPIKPYHLLIALLVGALLMYLLTAFWPKETISTRAQKELRADTKQMFKLSIFDSAQTRLIKKTNDSIRLLSKQINFWQAKYFSSIKVTRQQVAEVFKQADTTITKEVIKGTECDTLQRKQALEIKTLLKANAERDSLLKIRNESLKYSFKKDSTHIDFEKGLIKKVARRTAGEILLGVIAILVMVFH